MSDLKSTSCFSTWKVLGSCWRKLEEAGGPGRRFRTAPLEYPYGCGVNFQIEISDVDAMYKRVCGASSQVIIPLEERWYRRDKEELGNRQFVVADPDGYLLRFYTDLGQRPVLIT